MRYLLSISRAQRRAGDRDSVFGALYSRTCKFLYSSTISRVFSQSDVHITQLDIDLYLFGGLFLFYQMASRITIFVGPAGFIMFSFWWPQIISNVLKNSRRVFHK